jgi:hypothetical protein
MVLMRFPVMVWVLRRMFRLTQTPQGRKLLLLAWGAAARWYLRRKAVASRI